MKGCGIWRSRRGCPKGRGKVRQKGGEGRKTVLFFLKVRYRGVKTKSKFRRLRDGEGEL